METLRFFNIFGQKMHPRRDKIYEITTKLYLFEKPKENVIFCDPNLKLLFCC